MGIKERRERQKENLRQEILDVASELFANEGYDNVSMRKIAEQIEYSPTTIYLYFKDKTDLLTQICEDTFGKLIQVQEKILKQNSDDPLVCLRKGMRAYVDFGLKHPNHYELTFITPIMEFLGQDLRPYEGSSGQRAFNYLREGVAACIEHGSLKKGDVDTISQSLWAAIHGVTSLLIGHSDFPFVSKNKLIDCVIDTMIEGLKP
jgi:AcrR family transcriptional regulator